MRKRIIGTLIIGVVGAVVGAVTASTLHPAMGAGVFVLVAGLAAVVGLIGGGLLTLWVYWD